MRRQEVLRFVEPLLFGSDAPFAEGGSADQMDGSNDVLGQHAKRGFGADIRDASGEESPTARHSLDGSERMLGRAPGQLIRVLSNWCPKSSHCYL